MLIENENNGTGSSSSNQQKIEFNKFSDEKSFKPFIYQNNPSVILNQQPNYQPNPQFISMSDLSYTQTVHATAPDETVLQPNIQTSVQPLPTSPNEFLFQTSPNQQYIINPNLSCIQQISQSNPQNYANPHVIQVVPQIYSTTEYNTDEPPPSYESIMSQL